MTLPIFTDTELPDILLESNWDAVADPTFAETEFPDIDVDIDSVAEIVPTVPDDVTE